MAFLKVPQGRWNSTHSGFKIIYPVHYYPHSFLYFQVLGKATEIKTTTTPHDRKRHLIDGFALSPLNTINTIQYLLLHVNTDCYQAVWTPACLLQRSMLLQTRNLWKSFRFQLHADLSHVIPKALHTCYACVSDVEIIAVVERQGKKIKSLTDREVEIKISFVSVQQRSSIITSALCAQNNKPLNKQIIKEY